MTHSDYKDIPLEQIDASDRLRQPDITWVEALAQTIEANGLLNPITVRPMGENAYKLVAGAHRYAAFQHLGRTSIPAIIRNRSDDEARLDEILENIMRNELTAFNRAKNLFHLKDTYLKVFPHNKKGGDRKSAKRQALERVDENQSANLAQLATWSPELIKEQNPNLEIWSFSDYALLKTGLSRRSIYRAIMVYGNLTEDSRERIPGSEIEDNQSDLIALSEQDAEQQKKLLDLVLDPNEAPNSFAKALIHQSGKIVRDTDRLFKTTIDYMARFKPSKRRFIYDLHKDEIIDHARKEGWFDA